MFQIKRLLNLSILTSKCKGRGDEMFRKWLVSILRQIVWNYEWRHPNYRDKPAYICPNASTRNQNKRPEYRIPEDQPQCPVYLDNRCCGGCKFAAMCDYCVNCSCYGFTYAQMGGTDEGYYLHNASKYAPFGRLDKHGKFDWEYYHDQKKKSEIVIGSYIVIGQEIYKILSHVVRRKFRAENVNSGKRVTFIIDDIKHLHVFKNVGSAKVFLDICVKHNIQSPESD